MVTNLFSIFDPSGVMFMNGWIVMLFILALFPAKKYVSSAALSVPVKFVASVIKAEVDTPLGHGAYSMMSKALVSIFSTIVMMNLMGLLPYVFTPTAHMIIPMSMAIPFWLATYLFGWVLKPQQTFSHLVPVGTPAMLMPLMVIIESVSSLIRPITLSIRLMANMVAGHLLLSLASGSINSMMSLIASLPGQFILLGLELAVAMIQGYVFMILMTLYLKEV